MVLDFMMIKAVICDEESYVVIEQRSNTNCVIYRVPRYHFYIQQLFYIRINHGKYVKAFCRIL